MNKVKLINASWGYYGDEYDLFTKYVRRLRGNGAEDDVIKLVNAAGNSGDFNHSIEIGTSVSRNRYPTMYCNRPEFDHVYTATTLNRDGTAVENYSNEYVEVGVYGQQRRIPLSTISERMVNRMRAFLGLETQVRQHEGDMILGTFPDPLTGSKRTEYAYKFVKGSSYATAYLTGYLVDPSHDYDRRLGNLSINQTVNAAIIDSFTVTGFSQLQ